MQEILTHAGGAVEDNGGEKRREFVTASIHVSWAESKADHFVVEIQ